jgi:WD40 repeat protein
MRDETGPPRPDDVHACFTELLEGRGAAARALFDARTIAEAEELLREHHGLERMLPADQPTDDAVNQLRAGHEFDGFAVEGILGSGATGEVYAARELSTGRSVAIKVLAREVSQASGDRIDREARALASLEHPGIARLYRTGRIALEGSVHRFLSMELVRGARTLSQWRAEAPRTPQECVAILAQVCDAVAYAHGRGVIHCDLKPGNILVDDGDRPVVIDFGISRILDADGSPLATVSILGERVAGTLAYIAPESLDARAAADVRADVHALGAILYEMLAQRPFRALSDMPLSQRLAAVAAAEPPRLAAADRAFRGDLDRIVARATASLPGDRYQSVSQMADDLRRHLAGQPVLAELQPARERALRAIVRHRRAVLAATFASALLVATTLISLGFARTAVREARLANLNAAARAVDDADLLLLNQHLRGLGSADETPEGRLLARASTLRGTELFTGDCYAAAWSPDGTWCAVNDSDGLAVVRVDRSANGGFVPRWRVDSHSSSIHGIGITPDGSRVVMFARNGSIAVVDAASGQVVAGSRDETSADGVFALCIVDDDLALFSRQSLELRRLSDPATLVAAIDAGVGLVRACAPDPRNGRRIAIAGHEGAVLLDLDRREVLVRYQCPRAIQSTIAWSGDGARLFIGGWDRTLRCYAPDSPEPLWTSHGHRDSIWTIAPLDDAVVATAGADGSMRWWRATDGSPITALPCSENVIWSIAADPGGRELLVAAQGSLQAQSIDRLRRWSGRGGRKTSTSGADGVRREVEEHEAIASLSDDAAIVAVVRADGTLSVQSRPTGAVLWSAELAGLRAGRAEEVASLGIDAKAGIVVIGSRSASCVALELADGSERWRTRFPRQCAATGVGADGRSVYAADRDGGTYRLDARDGRILSTVRRHRTRVAAMSMSADGTRLICACADGSLRFLDAQTLEEQMFIAVSPEPLRSVWCEPDGVHTIDRAGVERVR